MGRQRKAGISTVGLAILLAAGAYKQFINTDTPPTNQSSSTSTTTTQTNSTSADNTTDYGTVEDDHPTESLARTVLTADVVKQLKTSAIQFNGTGSFIINSNKTDLNASVSSNMYVSLASVDSLRRPGATNALLTRSARQYKSRSETGNARTITPVGWQQTKIGGKYQYLYNRGHSIGYAIAGNVDRFDASEANEQNISTQTAWANQASNGDTTNTGQNYYETLVRRALDNNKRIRYRVTPLYTADNLVPSGTHLEAKSSDGTLQFNVFVPNVQPGVNINYSTGSAQVIN